MTISVFFLGLCIAGVLVAGLLAGCFIQRRMSTKRIGDANDLARRIVEEARKEAQAKKKKYSFRARMNCSTRRGNWKTSIRSRSGS